MGAVAFMVYSSRESPTKLSSRVFTHVRHTQVFSLSIHSRIYRAQLSSFMPSASQCAQKTHYLAGLRLSVLERCRGSPFGVQRVSSTRLSRLCFDSAAEDELVRWSRPS